MPKASTSITTTSSQRSSVARKTSTKKASGSKRGTREAQRRWTVYLDQEREKWMKINDFKHPRSALTITQTEAIKDYKITERDLIALPFETRKSKEKDHNDMKLFDVREVVKLAHMKAKTLGIPYVPRRSIPGSYRDRLNPTRPPVEERNYVPPEGHSLRDPSEEEIIWDGEFVRVNVNLDDACLLYQLEPEDLQDLTAQSNWLDVGTVARRALRLHGGFTAHNELVERRRAQAIAEYDTHGPGKLSAGLVKLKKEGRNPSASEPVASNADRVVKQYTPVWVTRDVPGDDGKDKWWHGIWDNVQCLRVD